MEVICDGRIVIDTKQGSFVRADLSIELQTSASLKEVDEPQFSTIHITIHSAFLVTPSA